MTPIYCQQLILLKIAEKKNRKQMNGIFRNRSHRIPEPPRSRKYRYYAVVMVMVEMAHWIWMWKASILHI